MSRLAKGQRAKSVLVRSEAVRASVLARLTILDEVTRAGTVNARQAPHFSSFEAFACWHEPALRITRLTPKTLRRHVAAVVTGGQAALLRRLRVAASLTQEASAMQKRSAGSRQKTAAAGAGESELVDHVHAFSQRYLDLLERMKRLAQAHDDVRVGLAQHFRLFSQDVPSLRRVK